jgi:excisionase family DNA binding protein
VNIELPDEIFETIAQRAAELVAERNGDAGGDGFLTVGDAAAFLACPKSRLYALVSADRIPHHRDGSRLLFDRAELRAYVAAGGAKRP